MTFRINATSQVYPFFDGLPFLSPNTFNPLKLSMSFPKRAAIRERFRSAGAVSHPLE